MCMNNSYLKTIIIGSIKEWAVEKGILKQSMVR